MPGPGQDDCCSAGSFSGRQFCRPRPLPDFTASGFGYALVYSAEVNRRFIAGDLAYFGADIAFGASLVLSAAWVSLALAAFRLGRRARRNRMRPDTSGDGRGTIT